jgi:hypothetical protein
MACRGSILEATAPGRRLSEQTFSCSQYGSQAYLAVIDPIKETGMQNDRLDAIEWPDRRALMATPLAFCILRLRFQS